MAYFVLSSDLKKWLDDAEHFGEVKKAFDSTSRSVLDKVLSHLFSLYCKGFLFQEFKLLTTL